VLQSFALWCYRRRRLVVVAWLLVLVVISVLGKQFAGEYAQSFKLPGVESQQAADLLKEQFPEQAGDEGQIVFRADDGVDELQVQSRMEQLFADVAGVKGVAEVLSPYGSPDQIAPGGQIAVAQIQFTNRAFQVSDATVEQITDLAQDANGGGVQVELGGAMFEQSGPPGSSELIGLLAAVVILLVAFGSLLAMGLPIVTALAGLGVGVAFIGVLANLISVPDFATQLAGMIGIGVGIDYALFIVTRFRQGLHDGLTPERAVVLAIDTAGRAVLFAGCTVVISVLGLFVMGVEFLRGVAIGTSVTVGLIMLASITLLPALLGFTGRNIDRFGLPGRKRRETSTRKSLWFRWSRVVQHRPLMAALVGLIILLVLAFPMLSIRLGFTDAGNSPTDQTVRRGYDLIAEGFGPGSNGPLILAADLPEGSDPAQLDAIATAVAATPGVADVSPWRVSPTGNAAVLRVVPDSAPQVEATVQLIDRLRGEVVPQATNGTDVKIYVGGFTASGADISDLFARRLPWFIGAVLFLSFILLLVVFRSVLVPLKAVIVNLLSIGAAYGVVVAVFQWGWFADVIGLDRTGPIVPFVPMMMFAIVFGLSMDYEVFLLSRIREEYDRTGDNGLAVADGLASTARVITAAALIMICVFGSFLLGADPLLKLFGLGLAGAIFIDATLVRLVLVPATMELLGDRNWWFPSWLERVTPRVHVEASVEAVAELQGHVPSPIGVD